MTRKTTWNTTITGPNARAFACFTLSFSYFLRGQSALQAVGGLLPGAAFALRIWVLFLIAVLRAACTIVAGLQCLVLKSDCCCISGSQSIAGLYIPSRRAHRRITPPARSCPPVMIELVCLQVLLILALSGSDDCTLQWKPLG